ncbi:MAG: hypothetical protein GVY29_07795, partial [Spirochaetes bacterium]|nr:hypothetical protein [Spirochaetota bacterium]
MTLKNDSLRVPFAEGRGGTYAKSKNLDQHWGAFRRSYETPHVAPVTWEEYQRLPKDAKTKVKNDAGWRMRAPVDKGKRNKGNTLPGVLISGDADFLDDEGVELLLSGQMFPGIEHFIHSTFSHSEDTPRYRVYILCDRPVPGHEYGIVVRSYLKLRDVMEYFDKASARVAQMMFRPAVASDMVDSYVYRHFPGETLDVDMTLMEADAYFGDQSDPENWPRWESETKDSVRARAARAEDPLTKAYPVGPWCNAYSIYDLIDGKDGEEPILGEFFEMAGDEHDLNRVNYIPGSGGAGCIIYDDGRFLYSHHENSDPGANENLNSWDLVRVHLFGHLDDQMVTYDRPSERPSWKEMLKFAQKDERFQAAAAEAQFSNIDALYDEIKSDEDSDNDEDPLEKVGLSDEELLDSFYDELDHTIPIAERAKPGKPPKNWRQSLTLDGNSQILPTIQNAVKILRYDPRFHNRIGWNEFYEGVHILSDIKSKVDDIPNFACKDGFKGTLWSDPDSHRARAILQAPRSENGYDLKLGKEDFECALVLAALGFTYNPVKEMLSERHLAHPEDDRNYLGDFLHEFFGVEDNIYHRQLWTNFMIAAVMRVYEPGSKFDFCP